MVLSNGVEVAQQPEEVIRIRSEDDVDTKRRAVEQAQVPIPAHVVRSSLQEYEEDTINRLLVRLSGKDVVGGWQMGPSKNGVQVRYGPVQDNDWYTMCTVGRVNVSPERAAYVLQTPHLVPKFEEQTKKLETLEKLSDRTEVRLNSCKSVMFTTARDFCVSTTVVKEDSGRVLIATRSVDHPDGQPRKDFCRALIFISGYVVTPDPEDPNACEIAVVAHMDLGGNIPAAMIKYLGLSAPIKLLEKMRQVMASDEK